MQRYYVRLVLAYVAFGRAYPAGTPGQLVNAAGGLGYVSFYNDDPIPIDPKLLERV